MTYPSLSLSIDHAVKTVRLNLPKDPRIGSPGFRDSRIEIAKGQDRRVDVIDDILHLGHVRFTPGSRNPIGSGER
jgi:hypothetical protein